MNKGFLIKLLLLVLIVSSYFLMITLHLNSFIFLILLILASIGGHIVDKRNKKEFKVNKKIMIPIKIMIYCLVVGIAIYLIWASNNPLYSQIAFIIIFSFSYLERDISRFLS